MTPAINVAKKAKIAYWVHEYEHDPVATSYALEAAEKMAVPAARIFKTLVVSLAGGELAVAVVPASSQLSMKQVARACGAKKAEMARPEEVQRSSGYVLGGVSPLGQKKRLTTIIDSSAQGFTTIYVSGGRRGLELELSAADLARLTRANFADICQ